jgi:hypothetical protein
MFINKKLKERVAMQKEIIAIIREIKYKTKANGLRLIDAYFYKKLGISMMTYHNMITLKNIGTHRSLKMRLKTIKALRTAVIERGKII